MAHGVYFTCTLNINV